MYEIIQISGLNSTSFARHLLIPDTFLGVSVMPGGQSKCRSPSSWKRFVGETRGRDDKTQQMETLKLKTPVVLDDELVYGESP